MAGLAVMKKNCFSSARSSLLKSMVRTGLVSFKATWHFSKMASCLAASLSPERAILLTR